jgi:hypothetical protein
MDCTLNIIGYRDCGNNYKYYLDDYGLSLLRATKIVDDKFDNAKDFINKLINQSWTETFEDITFDGFNANKILNDVSYGDIDKSGYFTGTKTTTFTLDDSCNLGSFYTSQLNVYVKTGGATTIQIIQGTVVSELYNDTSESDTIIELAINDFVDDIFQIKIITTGEIWTGISNGDCLCGNAPYYTIEAEDDLIAFNLTFQVRCNKIPHLCKYVDLIAPIVINKIMGKIWFWLYTTDAFSNTVNSEKEKAISMMVYFDSNYINLISTERNPNEKQGQYQIGLNKLNIPKPTCQCCMECKSSGWTVRGMKP